MNFAKRLGLLASLAIVCATAARAQAPVFTSSLDTTGYVGVAFSFQLMTDVQATFGIVSGLPAELTLEQDWITGTPLIVGTNSVLLTATNIYDNSTSTTNLTLVIRPATPSPVITSPSSKTAVVGELFTYLIVATNATGFGATGLPSGWTLDSISGLISGTPDATGVLTISLTASNATAIPYHKPLTITVLSADTTNAVFKMEDFEGTLPAAWQVGDAHTSGTPAYWGVVDTPFAGVSAASGSRMAYCAGIGYGGTSENPKYQNNMRAYLQRVVDLSGSSAATLSFSSRIAGLETVFDSCRVLISNDAGSHWTEVWKVSRVDADWTAETVVLDAYAGDIAVTIRFEFDSDANINDVGWFLDDIAVATAQGDRFDNATAIDPGTNYVSSVAAPNALDVSKVSLRQGYTYVITAIGGTLSDPQLWLFDSSRNQQAYNDDASGMGLNSRITFKCEESDEYYVQVGGRHGSFGSYTLLVAEQTARADIEAVSVSMTLSVDDPRGSPPDALEFTLQNNGPMGLDNDTFYSYQVEVWLSPSRTSVGSGMQIGSETIDTFAMAADESSDESGEVSSYAIPDDLPGGDYYVWLHVMPLEGSPVDPKLANNWVASTNVIRLPDPPHVTISGKVTTSGGTAGMSGVTILLVSENGSITNTAVTGADGTYGKTLDFGWTGTVTPSSNTAGLFWPAVRTYTNVVASLVSQNFAQGSPLVISGRLTAKSGATTSLPNGVTVAFAGNGAVQTVIADANGYYSNNVVVGWTGTVTPATNGVGGAFSPASKSYRKLAASKAMQNFTWTPPPVISGKVTIKGTKNAATNVVIVISGVGTNNTDATGYYSMTVPYNWTGSVTPSTAGRGGTFSPKSKSFSKLTAARTQNFTWTAPVVRALQTPAATAKPDASQGEDLAAVLNMAPKRLTASLQTAHTRQDAVRSVPVRAFPSVANRTAGNVATPGVATTAGSAPLRQLLHTVGRVRWTGEDAARAQQSPVWLTLSLADGVVTVTPTVPMAAPGDLSTALEFMDGLAGRVGAPDGDLLVVRNINGLAMTEAVLNDTVILGDVLVLAPGPAETILTWDLLLLEP